MGFQVSPGINVTEIDLTTIIPAVATTTGAIAAVSLGSCQCSNADRQPKQRPE